MRGRLWCYVGGCCYSAVTKRDIFCRTARRQLAGIIRNKTTRRNAPPARTDAGVGSIETKAAKLPHKSPGTPTTARPRSHAPLALALLQRARGCEDALFLPASEAPRSTNQARCRVGRPAIGQWRRGVARSNDVQTWANGGNALHQIEFIE